MFLFSRHAKETPCCGGFWMHSSLTSETWCSYCNKLKNEIEEQKISNEEK
jgi:hypothetical protein